MKNRLILVLSILVLQSIQEECVPTAIEYTAIHRDFKKLQKEVETSSTQDGEPLKSFQCKCYLKFTSDGKECKIQPDKNNPSQPDCKASDYIESTFSLRKQEEDMEKYIKFDTHLKTDFRAIMVGSEKQNVMGLGNIAVRGQKMQSFYMPMDIVALKYQNGFSTDREGLLNFLKRVNNAKSYEQNESSESVEDLLKKYSDDRQQYMDSLGDKLAGSKDVRAFKARIVSLDAYPFCFYNDEVMESDLFKIDQCNMCARLCHDNLNIDQVKTMLTCNGEVEDEEKTDDEGKSKLGSLNKLDIGQSIKDALSMAANKTPQDEQQSQEENKIQGLFNKAIEQKVNEIKQVDRAKMAEISQKDEDELTEEEKLFKQDYTKRQQKEKENGPIDQVTVDIAMKFYDKKMGVSSSGDKIAKKKQKTVLDALKYLFMSQEQCNEDCKGQDCNCIGENCSCQGPDCYVCEGEKCEKYVCDENTPKNECRCKGNKCKCKGRNCGCTGDMCVCQNKGNCKCTDPTNGCMCTEGIDCENDIIDKDPDVDCSRYDKTKYPQCAKPKINECRNGNANWPECKNWKGKCKEDTLKWPGCNKKYNPSTDTIEDNDPEPNPNNDDDDPKINQCRNGKTNWPECKDWEGKCEKDTLKWPGCSKKYNPETDKIEEDPDPNPSDDEDDDPKINQCRNGKTNWPQCKDWEGKCEKDTLKWPGCSNKYNPETDKIEEDDPDNDDEDDVVVDPEKIKKYRLQDNEVSLEQFEAREFKPSKDQEYWLQQEVSDGKKQDRRFKKAENGGSIEDFKKIQEDINQIVNSVGDGNKDEYFNQLKDFQHNFDTYFKSQSFYDSRAKQQRLKKQDSKQLKFNQKYLKDVEKIVGEYRNKFIQRKKRMKQIIKESFDQQLRQRLRKMRNA